MKLCVTKPDFSKKKKKPNFGSYPPFFEPDCSKNGGYEPKIGFIEFNEKFSH